MNDIQEQVTGLKDQIARARDRQARAAFEVERAQKDLYAIRKELADTFGAHDAADVARVLGELRIELGETIKRLTAALDAAE